MWPGRTGIGASAGLMALFVLETCGGSSAARDEQAWRLAERVYQENLRRLYGPVDALPRFDCAALLHALGEED
jgi:hypothetical protein